MIQGSPEENRMGSKRNTGKKRRAPEKAGEHRKNEELSGSTGKTWRVKINYFIIDIGKYQFFRFIYLK